jgi:hypothetical protein
MASHRPPRSPSPGLHLHLLACLLHAARLSGRPRTCSASEMHPKSPGAPPGRRAAQHLRCCTASRSDVMKNRCRCVQLIGQAGLVGANLRSFCSMGCLDALWLAALPPDRAAASASEGSMLAGWLRSAHSCPAASHSLAHMLRNSSRLRQQRETAAPSSSRWTPMAYSTLPSAPNR